ncbi:hypothetical protein CIB84_008605, partial [Bambusicola thoracicus]
FTVLAAPFVAIKCRVSGRQSPRTSLLGTSPELKKQVESAELKNQRLKEIFQTKIQEFRKVCYTLTGYQIDITTENQYRLTSIYAEHQGDCLLFKERNKDGMRTWRLFSKYKAVLTDCWLKGDKTEVVKHAEDVLCPEAAEVLVQP